MTKRLARPHLIRAPGKLGYRGVRMKSGRRRPFYARVKIGEREIYTQYFAMPHEAAIAYDGLALKFHGEKAVLNFPNGILAAVGTGSKT